MRIGLDATRIRQPSGEGTYTREVISHLVRMSPDDRFFIVVPEQLSFLDAPNVEQIVYGEVDGIAARLRYAVEIGRIARRHSLDVFHNLTNYLAIGTGCPVVTTIHDLASRKHPEVRRDRIDGLVYRYIFPLVLRLSARLVAISRSTRDDIDAYYGLGERTRVVYNGINHALFNTTRAIADDSLARFRLPANYLLFVGYLTPKKNLEIVLQAMRRLADAGQACPLVLVGKRGEGSEGFFRLAERLGLKSLLVETGFVSDDELTLLYRRAGALVFPSIYEGFGLPVVEAMACGIPVLASGVSSLPELVADPCSLCPPTDTECWIEGIRAALHDPEVRARAASQGPERARQFSWEATARSLRAIYGEIVNESAGIFA